ncbi:hypothetical protein HK097_002846 [Rhizophlyctis rosea]|uniref:WD40 repeat-like protein n=1 Tax=Rhizophlyctis rosea TaxID=64517 RepID=A0AAD5X407_9FUNG|nr:hypothetical protein HK097_002846 [Rhizophlyctis rosea]
MNLELLDPFGQDFPEVIEDRLAWHEHEITITCCRFNRRGTLLASATLEGICLVWDLATKGVARVLRGHSLAITSLSTAGHEKDDISSHPHETGTVYYGTWKTAHEPERFGSLLQLSPLPYIPETGELPCLVKLPDDPGGAVVRTPLVVTEEHAASLSITLDTHSAVVTFTPNGSKIYVGTTKGVIVIFDTVTGKSEQIFRAAGTATIKHIEFSRKGSDLVVNATDRIIRLYSVKHSDDGTRLDLQHKFQDSVNRNAWAACCFSADGEYVIGGSAQKQRHDIYIWDKESRNLVKMLEGPREDLSDLTWHPHRPMIASVTSYGIMYVWSVNYVQNYSAFAPTFEELEDNEEYEEHEDEFDIKPEDPKPIRRDEDDLEIDVVTIERINAFSDDDEEDNYHLPTYPDESDDEGGGSVGKRKKVR